MASASRWPESTSTSCRTGSGSCAGTARWPRGRCGRRWTRRQHYKLANLIAIVDVNRLGQRGPTDLGWDTGAYRRRAEAFGARTFVIDGHDVAAIDEALAQAGDLTGDQPAVILARTIKGKGFSEVEDAENWHGKPFPQDMAERAVVELGGEQHLVVRGPRPASAVPGRMARDRPRHGQRVPHPFRRLRRLRCPVAPPRHRPLHTPARRKRRRRPLLATHPRLVRSLAEAVVVGPKCNRAGENRPVVGSWSVAAARPPAGDDDDGRPPGRSCRFGSRALQSVA